MGGINMKKLTLDEVRELAMSATPGPWVGDEFEMTAPNAPTLFDGNVKLVFADDYHMNEEDAKYIMAVNPKNVLEIIEELKKLREIVGILKEEIDYGHGSDDFSDEIFQKVQSYFRDKNR